MRHHAIVVTTGYGDWHLKAHAKAVELGMDPTEVRTSGVNSYDTFLIPPDGSKEGWPASAEGDARRAAFIAWVRDQVYADGSNPIAYAEVQYGDDEHEAKLVRSSDDDCEEFRNRHHDWAERTSAAPRVTLNTPGAADAR
jgi:hypothetical protein